MDEVGIDIQIKRRVLPDIRTDRRLGIAEHVIAVVVPAYRVRSHILPLLALIGPEVAQIFVVDDACPDHSGADVLARCADRRVVVLVHEHNQGVGGAVITGYQRAVAAGADVVVKLDGDGQMDPAMIPQLVAPILQGQADYVKGNRFYNLEDVRTMPWTRLIGNATLSFITKLSSGYWKLFDPTNGYTAISAAILPYIRWHKVKRRYFFESDLLFHLGIINATVLDLPMTAIYANEKSGMTVLKVFRPFLAGNLGNLFRRVFYSYFLRDFSLASLELVMGVVLLVFGLAFGTWGWATSIATERPATTGTVMLASLPVILGFQMLQSFLAFDIAATPNRVITPLLPPKCMSGEVLARVRFQARCGEVS